MALLIDNGAKLRNARMRFFFNAADCVVLSVMKVLLDKGAHKTDEEGPKLALEEAQNLNRHDAVTLLQEYGVSLDEEST